MQEVPVSVILRMSLIMALAVFGNLFLVFVIRRGNAVARQRVSPVQLLLLHTCMADLLFALLCLGTQIIILYTYPYFYGPDLVCRLVRYLQVLPLYASPFLLVAISIDRYQAICRPLVHYRSDRFRRPNCLGLTAWFLALLCSAPQLFIWRKDPLGTYRTGKELVPLAGGGGHQLLVTDDGTTLLNLSSSTAAATMATSMLFRNSTNTEECHTIYGNEDPDLWKCIYVVWFSTVAWLLPSLMSGIFYFRVCSTVWKSRFWGRSDEDDALPPATVVGTATRSPTVTLLPTQQTKVAVRAYSCQLTRDYVEGLRKSSTGFRNQISEFDRKRIQTVRLTLTIVVCNFFLWLPFCATNVIQAFWGLKLLSSDVIVYIVILGNLNACVNPWIYILWNPRQTRRALISIMRRRMDSTNFSTSATRQTSIGMRMSANPHQQQQQQNGCNKHTDK